MSVRFARAILICSQDKAPGSCCTCYSTCVTHTVFTNTYIHHRLHMWICNICCQQSTAYQNSTLFTEICSTRFTTQL